MRFFILLHYLFYVLGGGAHHNTNMEAKDNL